MTSRHIPIWSFIAALAIALIGASPATADDVNHKLHFATVAGSATVHKSVAKWSFWIQDPKPNNRGVYALIRFDLKYAHDWISRKSKTTSGGRIVSFESHLAQYRINGMRIYLCEDRRPNTRDYCKQVAYVAET